MQSASNECYIDKLVSVIIPTYNSSQYIEKTVKSVLAQTYSNLEIILIDDCSSDNTQETIKKIASLDNRVRFVFQGKNSGAAIARNTGIAKAKGRYIAFLDSDDIWEPNKIQIQMNALLDGHPFVYSTYDTVNATGKTIGRSIKIKEHVTYKDLLTKTYISTPTVIFDRYYFGDLTMPLRRTGQDYAFWLVLLKQSDAYGIDKTLVHVTKRAGSLSKNKLQSLKDVYEVQTKFEKIPHFTAVINTFRYFLYAIKKYLIYQYTSTL